MNRPVRITKAEWQKLGGLRNTQCWRKQLSNGSWAYYYNYSII